MRYFLSLLWEHFLSYLNFTRNDLSNKKDLNKTEQDVSNFNTPKVKYQVSLDSFDRLFPTFMYKNIVFAYNLLDDSVEYYSPSAQTWKECDLNEVAFEKH